MMKIWIVLFAMVAVGVLSACGGGGGGSAAPNVKTPPAVEMPPETPPAMETPPDDMAMPEDPAPPEPAPQPVQQARVIDFGENENQFLAQYAPSDAQLPDRGGKLTLTLSQSDFDALQAVLAEYRQRRPVPYSFEYRSRHEAEQVFGRLGQVTADIYELAQVHTADPTPLTFTPGANGGTVEIALSRFHADRLEKLRDDYRYTFENPMTNTIAICAPHIWENTHNFPAFVGHRYSCDDARHGRRVGKYDIGTIHQIVTTTITRVTAVLQMVEYRIALKGSDTSSTATVVQMRPSHSCLSESNCVEQGYTTFLQVVHEGYTLILLSGSDDIEIKNGEVVHPSHLSAIHHSRAFSISGIGIIHCSYLDDHCENGYLFSANPVILTATTLTALPEDVVALFPAPPKPKHYYTLETRDDDAWADAGNDFAFNLRGVISQGAIRAGGFMFVSDEPAHNAHLEYRADPMTLSGVRIFADSGFKYENSGETQAHYAKAMAAYRLFGAPDDAEAKTNDREFALDLYSSAAIGKVHSEYYEDSRLYGFAAGMLAARVFGTTDEWHFRVRRPLSAREINPLLLGADVRFGENDSQWQFGFSRDLDNGTDRFDASAVFRF